MAPRTGGLATEIPGSSPLNLIHFIPSDDIAKLNKRPPEFESKSASSRSQGIDLVNPFVSPSKVARLSLATTARTVVPLTGVAALGDERRRRQVEDRASTSPSISPNPSNAALKSLMSGSDQAMSRPSDVVQVAPTAIMEPAAKAATALSMATGDVVRSADHDDVNRPTNPSAASLASITESATLMDVDSMKNDPMPNRQNLSPSEKHQPGSLSYPGPLQAAANLPEAPARGMSFPIPGQGQDSPTASGGKKHKCPYCNTEFTRHHNLKSHLLTHSQEKPYVCTECQMRFRRLHDLKRHGKLHTGEKPHICPKCDRKFARGDALARHSKGAGGCAGRRASMGSFADGDDLDGTMGEGDDSNMSGLAYDNPDDDELRRQSLPSIGAQHPSGDSYAAHSRTYPPAGPRPAASGLYPPNASQSQLGTTSSSSGPESMNSSHTANTSISSVPGGSVGAGMYSQAGMTESPRPLSPGLSGHETTNLARQRSPSMSQPFPQQQMGRRPSDLQSPHSGQVRPKLPGLSHPSFAGPSSGPYTHGRTPSGTQNAVESSNMFAQSDPSVWEYMRLLEDKIKSLSDKVTSLDNEVAGLKKQLEARDGPIAA